MSDNYCQTSSYIDIPEDKLEKAHFIIDRVVKELESEDSDWGYAGFTAAVKDGGVWIHGDEISPEHMEMLVNALVEELDLEGSFTCSWAYTCSEYVRDRFGGGAFTVQKGMDTVWVDAANAAYNEMVTCCKNKDKE